MAQQEPRTNRKHSESVAHESTDILAERIAWMKEAFPEAVSEKQVDFDRLRDALGDVVEGQRERYGLNWAGKRDCIQLLQTTSQGTLVPVPDESVDFENSGNVFIEGENLEVLKLLYKAYFGKIKAIYIDPPYNTGQVPVYCDDYSDPLSAYLALSGQKDAEGNLLTSNPEASGRHHSRWLSMMYPRLFVARQLLTDDGVVFISIDDHEVHNLRAVCDEVFGEENRIATIVWNNATDNNPTRVAVEHEYILVYAKQVDRVDAVWHTSVSDIKDRLLEIQDWFLKLYSDSKERQAQYAKWLRENKTYLSPLDRYRCIDDRGIYTGSQSVHNPGREGYRYDVIHPRTGKPCKQPLMGYRFPRETMDGLLSEGRVLFGKDESKIIELKVYLDEFEDKLSSVVTLDGRLGAYDLKEVFPEFPKLFPNPKPVSLVGQLLSFVLKQDDMVLDFFAGTCTTAHAAIDLLTTRSLATRFVMVQLPEEVDEKTETGRNARNSGFYTIADIGKERVRRVVNRVNKKRNGRPGDGDTPVGFRVFRLDRSNYRLWDSSDATEPEGYSSQLALHIDPLLDGWKKQDVIWEVALKEGWGLDSRIESVAAVSDCTVHRVTSADGTRSFLISLDDHLSLDALRPLGLKQEDLFICRDCALTDETAANLALQCRLKTI